MNLIKILYWLVGSYSLSQSICKDGDYYCNILSKCLHKDDVCENNCNICLDKQKMGENIDCDDKCDHEVVDQTYKDDCLYFTRCINGYEIYKNNNTCSCKKEKIKTCDNEYVCPIIKVLPFKLTGYTTYELSLIVKNDKNPLTNFIKIF